MNDGMKELFSALILTVLLSTLHPLPLWGAVYQSAPQASHSGAPATALQAADAAFHAGYAAAQSNDLPVARRSFEEAVRLAPQVAAGHAALGSVLLALGEPVRAVPELETAHRLDQSDTSTLLNLCVAYSRTRDYKRSIAAYRELEAGAIALPADAAFAVAAAFSATGDSASAQAAIQQAIQTDTRNASLQDALGALLAQQRDYINAEGRFRQAIALDPTLASAHYHLGSVESATNRAPDALAEFGQAHAIDPDNVPYSLDLARVLLLDHQDSAATDLLRATLARLGPEQAAQAIEVKYRLALALQSADNLKEALPLFTEVVAARPDDAEALTNAGLAHVQLGDAKGGIPLYLRALKLTPSNATLREDLGVAYLQQADLDHALEQFRAGLLIDDQSPQLHYDLALALKLKDDLAAAIPEFERAAALDPQLPDPPFTLGIIYMQQGKFEKSAASFETALALRPDNGEAWATLGSVYQQMQQPEKAIPALRKAIALMPQQPSPHITLGAILAAQGHKEEAVAERKIGAELTRAVTNRQKANFGLDSGTLLMKRGQTDEALVQFQNAVEADPNYAAPHLALAGALDHVGRKAEAAEERRKAATLEASTPPKAN
jgi:tetratricopeptide (TPR) repeat protein